MPTRQQLPVAALLFSTWLAAISLSMLWLGHPAEPDEIDRREGRDSSVVEAGGYWLATEEIWPVGLALLVLVGTVVLVVCGTIAAGTSIPWLGISVSGLALALVFIIGTAVAEAQEDDRELIVLAGFYLWRGALVATVIAGVWHSLVTDDLVRNGEPSKEKGGR